MMAEKSRGLLFRKRTVLGAVLAAGIGLGVYLGQFKGFGLGGSGFWGIGAPTGQGGQGQGTTATSDGTGANSNSDSSQDSTMTQSPKAVAQTVSVLIDGHKYLKIGDKGSDTSIDLPDLVELVKKATGDSDGIRLKIYEKQTARAKAEEDLKEALAAADVPESAVFWVPAAVSK